MLSRPNWPLDFWVSWRKKKKLSGQAGPDAP